ncbi:DinB family protein [Kocuria sp. JC486]|uniref:mycothiol transferase n=1 Tax=Kocuria sp. JC486 TaxID=1970736 RepID=UPI0014226F9B|nr:DinB family protein [Kocuria sp. JC486]NHU85384.1 DinB family protein [Kocuria sp. JC486]
MTAALTILIDAAQRAPEVARMVTEGLPPEAAHERPADRQNSIAWLIWHAARQQDVQVAELAGTAQVWDTGKWAERTGVDRDSRWMGFGESAEGVAAFRAGDIAALADYLDATVQATVDYVRTLSDEDLDEVIDHTWEPPVTRGTRLVSTIDDAAQHMGQAAYARSLVDADWKAPY